MLSDINIFNMANPFDEDDNFSNNRRGLGLGIILNIFLLTKSK